MKLQLIRASVHAHQLKKKPKNSLININIGINIGINIDINIDINIGIGIDINIGNDVDIVLFSCLHCWD